jgi:hypothetical protein
MMRHLPYTLMEDQFTNVFDNVLFKLVRSSKRLNTGRYPPVLLNSSAYQLANGVAITLTAPERTGSRTAEYPFPRNRDIPLAPRQ